MKNLFCLAAFAASASALVGRAEPACCFHLNVTGEVTGPLGQLTDGQSRVGDNSLSQSQFCINSTGVIVDTTGKGCIITAETTQFQCDEGKPGTPGFSISPTGELQFHGSSYFIACETGQNGGMNIYTTNSTSVTMCKAVYLSADSCLSAGNAPVISIPPPPGANLTTGGGGGGGGAVAPGGSAAPPASVTIISTVTVSNCVCSTTFGPSAPGAPGIAAPAPGQPSSASGPGAPVISSQTIAAPGGTPPAIVPILPAPGHTSVASESVTAATGGAQITGSAGQSSAPSGGQTALPSPHTSVAPVAPIAPVPGQSSAPTETHPASESSQSSAASNTHPPSPCPACSQSSSTATAQPSSVCPTCSQSASTSSAHESSVCPSCSQSAVSSSIHTSSIPATATPSGPCPSCPQTAVSNSTHASSIPVTSAPASSTHISSVPVTSAPSSTIHANTTSTRATSTSASATSCPTDLSGEYQYPHLVVRVDSAKPDVAEGTGFNGTINSTVSTAFNFDIPQSYSGKTCSLIFLFPRKEELQTTSYSFMGDGKVVIGKLSSTVSSSTTYNNIPSVSQGLGTITISPGHSYLVSTFSCPAGQAVAYEMSNAGSTDFEFFQDYNPSPLGLYITAC